MMERPTRWLAAAALAAGLQLAPAALAAQHQHATGPTKGLAVPPSMREEHDEIHGALEAAAVLQGVVGDAARDLVRVLAPHFERENQIALPPLALLRPLSRGEAAADDVAAARALTDTLRAELPRMLEEHVAIAAAAKRLEETARKAGDTEREQLAQKLQHHARTEEEITYPAALVVGELIRAHGGGH